MSEVLPPAGTPFGDRVRQRLRDERVIWLTTTGADGTPQPNPVWFLWQDPSSLLIYNRTDAYRLLHIRRNPRVALHMDSDGQGGDVAVLTGAAAVVGGHPLAHEHPEYLAKYEASAARVGGTPAEFAAQYPVAMIVQVEKVRGF